MFLEGGGLGFGCFLDFGSMLLSFRTKGSVLRPFLASVVCDSGFELLRVLRSNKMCCMGKSFRLVTIFVETFSLGFKVLEKWIWVPEP